MKQTNCFSHFRIFYRFRNLLPSTLVSQYAKERNSLSYFNFQFRQASPTTGDEVKVGVCDFLFMTIDCLPT